MRTPIVALAGWAMVLSACSGGSGGPRARPTEPGPAAAPSFSVDATGAVDPRPPSAGDLGSVELSYALVADDLRAPVLALARPGSRDLWVVEQAGRVVAIGPDGDSEVVIDVTDLVAFGGERGLLGLAFSPDHATTGDVVLHYSAADADGATRIERWSVSADGPANPGALVLQVAQPASNHNGGMIQFGPDGMLYVALGDGGRANDAFGNGQRPDTLLGSILRLDLTAEPYAIPADNPFVDGRTPDGAPAAREVWAWGLRNPWRTWIDDGRMYIGDVGQGRIEEVDVIGLDQGGANLGWPIREGAGCFQSTDCASDGLVMPVAEFDHDGGACSITGGVVQRGPSAPDLVGHYFYSDFCAGFLRSLRVDENGAAVDQRDWTDQVGVPTQVTSFGVDHEGNVLVVGADGTIRRLVQVV